MNSSRTSSSKEIVRQAGETVPNGNCDIRSVLCKEIVINALKCRHDTMDILDLKILNRTMAEYQYAARVFKPYRHVRKVSIFGSSRAPEGSPYYEMARCFGRLVAEHGFMAITGAAQGIMRAGIEGCGADKSFGVNIMLPFEKSPADIIKYDRKLVKFKYFFTRKLFFVMEADAIALFPGGFGTHDEGFEVLTLLQTGKSSPMPVVLLELPEDDYWQSWDRFVRQQFLAREFIREADLSLYKIVRSPLEGLEIIRDFYGTYHSVRQVHDKLIIRLEKELADQDIEHLNDSFRDIIKSGRIMKSTVLPEEADEPGALTKPRLAFCYNRSNAGRLNEMILKINEMGHNTTGA
jgi:uncharacterized protein (TIGR00730 family)